MLNQTEQIFNQIDRAQKIAIVFGRDWLADSVASGLALSLFLQKLGKQVALAAAEPINPQLSWLPGFGQIQTQLNGQAKFIISLNTANASVAEVKYKLEPQRLDFIITPQSGSFAPTDVSADSGGFDCQLIMAVNCPDLESLGQIFTNQPDLFYQTPIINLDCQAANENYGQINLVNLNAVSTTEVLFDLMSEQRRELIDEDIATCLLCGMISATRSFKTANVTPNALLAVSELINFGGRREQVVNNLYRNKPLNVLQLWGKTLDKMQSTLDNKLIWSVLAPLDFSQTAAQPADLQAIVDELIVSVPQALIITLIYQVTEQSNAVALVYSVKNINCLNLVKEFEPQGAKNLVIVNSATSAQNLADNLIELITGKLTKLPL